MDRVDRAAQFRVGEPGQQTDVESLVIHQVAQYQNQRDFAEAVENRVAAAVLPGAFHEQLLERQRERRRLGEAQYEQVRQGRLQRVALADAELERRADHVDVVAERIDAVLLGVHVEERTRFVNFMLRAVGGHEPDTAGAQDVQDAGRRLDRRRGAALQLAGVKHPRAQLEALQQPDESILHDEMIRKEIETI